MSKAVVAYLGQAFVYALVLVIIGIVQEQASDLHVISHCIKGLKALEGHRLFWLQRMRAKVHHSGLTCSSCSSYS